MTRRCEFDEWFHDAGTYSSKYSKYLRKIFLCLKNGDRVQTSSSSRVWAPADLKMGSTYEKLIHCQRFAASSGLVSSYEDGCTPTPISEQYVHVRWDPSLHRLARR